MNSCDFSANSFDMNDLLYHACTRGQSAFSGKAGLTRLRMVVFAPIVWLFKIAHFLRFLGMLNSHATNRILNLWKSDLVISLVYL